MARGVNKVLLIGHLGKDPELKTLPSGSAVANVSLATSDSWKDKKTGEDMEKCEWHNLVFYGRLAEILAEHCKKGSKIYVEGSLQTRKWQDKDTGKDRYMTEINVREMRMLDGKTGVVAEDDERAAIKEESAPGGDIDIDAEIPF